MNTHLQIPNPPPETWRQPPERAAVPGGAQRRPTPAAAPRRSKADALRIVQQLKRMAAIAAMLGFGMFGIAVGSHIATSSATAAAHTSTTTSTTATSTSSTTSSGGSVTQQSGGSSFSSASSASTPVTSTGVS